MAMPAWMLPQDHEEEEINVTRGSYRSPASATRTATNPGRSLRSWQMEASSACSRTPEEQTEEAVCARPSSRSESFLVPRTLFATPMKKHTEKKEAPGQEADMDFMSCEKGRTHTKPRQAIGDKAAALAEHVLPAADVPPGPGAALDPAALAERAWPAADVPPGQVTAEIVAPGRGRLAAVQDRALGCQTQGGVRDEPVANEQLRRPCTDQGQAREQELFCWALPS